MFIHTVVSYYKKLMAENIFSYQNFQILVSKIILHMGENHRKEKFGILSKLLSP